MDNSRTEWGQETKCQIKMLSGAQNISIFMHISSLFSFFSISFPYYNDRDSIGCHSPNQMIFSLPTRSWSNGSRGLWLQSKPCDQSQISLRSVWAWMKQSSTDNIWLDSRSHGSTGLPHKGCMCDRGCPSHWWSYLGKSHSQPEGRCICKGKNKVIVIPYLRNIIQAWHRRMVRYLDDIYSAFSKILPISLWIFDKQGIALTIYTLTNQMTLFLWKENLMNSILYWGRSI